MDYRFRRVEDQDRDSIVSIYNHYVETSFAAYFVSKVEINFYHRLAQMALEYPFYVIESEGGQIIGFGLMHRYHPSEAFDHTAELTYFILPSHTKKGLGTQLLNLFVEQACKIGINTFLAGISSLNQDSLDFHRKNGFHECGRFFRVGKKFDKDFDVVWMQKHL